MVLRSWTSTVSEKNMNFAIYATSTSSARTKADNWNVIEPGILRSSNLDQIIS